MKFVMPVRLAPFVVALCIAGLLGCGGGSSPSNAAFGETQEELERALERIGAAIDDGAAGAVCDGLTAGAREQLANLGHEKTDCRKGVGMLMPGLREGRQAGGGRPTIERAAVRSVVATVDVEGRLVRVRLIKEGEQWKFASFYGLVPKSSSRFD